MACMKKECVEARRLAEQNQKMVLNNKKLSNSRYFTRKKLIGDCGNLTQETFTNYLNIYLELRDNNQFNSLGLDSGYINQQISLLANAVVDKTENPNSCHYKDYITIWERDKRVYEDNLI